MNLLKGFHVIVGGRTFFFQIHHNKFDGKIFEIGEQVLVKPNMTIRGKEGNPTRPRWIGGTWVDSDDRTHEHLLILNSGQAARVRSVRTVPASERWNAEAVLAIKATPNAQNLADAQQKGDYPARDAMRKDGVVHGQNLPERPMRNGNQKGFHITRKTMENIRLHRRLRRLPASTTWTRPSAAHSRLS